MVIACDDDTDVNIGVYDDAEKRAMLVNVVDVPPLCNFILPAILRTGPLAIAISTAGASPALAKRMKAEVAELFGEEYAQLAVMLNDVARLGEGHAADLPGPQGVLRGHRQRRARPDRAAARRRRRRPCATSSPPRSPRRRPPRRGERAHPPRRARHRPHGRRRRQAGDRPPRRRPRASCACRRDDRRDRPRGRRARRATSSGPRGSPASRPPSGTGELIPLCHPLGLDHVDVDAEVDAAAGRRDAHRRGAGHRAHRASRWRR